MRVSFKSLVLVLCFSVSRATGNKNVALKDKLASSLTHVRAMLRDMELKIDQERKVLAQINAKLNHKGGGGEVDILPSQLDYDGVTDIWWSLNFTDIETTTRKYGNVSFETTPSLFPRPTTYATLLLNAAASPFIADMERNMILNRHGYFTAFAEKFTELIHTKNESDGYPVAHHVAVVMHQQVENGSFDRLGVDLLAGLNGKLIWFEALSPKRLKDQAGVVHFMLKIVENSLSADLKALLKFYDNMFTKEEGLELFESLESFYMFPEGNATFESIGERMLEAAFVPYFKSEGKRKQKRLIQLVLMAVHDIDPNFRAQTIPSLKNSNANANYSTKDHNQTAFPVRRRMNYKKIVKHFLVKHPKLFRKIKRQYKDDKKNKHHRFSHTRKRHNNYPKSRGGHQRRERLYDREQTRQRAYTGSSYETENEEDQADSSESGAYYRENSEVYQQKNIHTIQRAQKSEIRTDKLKQHTQKQHKAKQKQWNILKRPRASTKPYQDDPQYIKQLAIRFLRNKQQRRNFYSNRRFNIPSSEEDFCNHSQTFQDSIENYMLHKIREDSNYSDEEDHLRNNLYDALRHGNRTFVSFRKSGGGVNNKQILRALSSETDDEWVLKNNIYKVFEQEKN